MQKARRNFYNKNTDNIKRESDFDLKVDIFLTFLNESFLFS